MIVDEFEDLRRLLTPRAKFCRPLALVPLISYFAITLLKRRRMHTSRRSSGTGLRIRRNLLAETCGSPPFPTRLLAPFLKARRTTPRNPPHAGNETPGPQVQIPHRTA